MCTFVKSKIMKNKNILIVSLILVITFILVSCGGEQTSEVSVDTSMEDAPPKTNVEVVTKEEEEIEQVEDVTEEESESQGIGLQIISEEVKEEDIEQESEMSQTIELETSGFSFSSDELIISSGDTIRFILGSSHNAVEVDEDTWNSNGQTALEDGFNVNFGSTEEITFDEPRTYYYVCQPHAGMGMKGKIIVE